MALVKQCDACWDSIMDVLYSPEEKMKLEWAIGAVVSGDSKKIQKFIVLYGDKETDKGTYLKILVDNMIMSKSKSQNYVKEVREKIIKEGLKNGTCKAV